MNEYYTIKIELDLDSLRERIINTTMKHVGPIVLGTDTVWTIDCGPKDVSEVMEAAKAVFDESMVKHVTIYRNWTDPEWDEDMVDIIWYDGKPKSETRLDIKD